MLEDLRIQFRQEGKLNLTVRVRPNAPKTQVKSVLEDGSIKIDVAAPSEGGKANTELVRFLANEFGVPVSNVEIKSGATARVKQVRILACRK